MTGSNQDKRFKDALSNGINAKALSELDMPDPNWVVHGLLPEGLTLLVGKPKIGKSWMSINLAVSISNGSPTLGSYDTECGTVLYLALEDSRRRLKQRLKIVLGEAEPSENLHFFTEWPRMDKGGIEQLRIWMECYPNTKLIIIDTLAKVKRTSHPGRSSYDEDYKALEDVHKLASEHGITIILIHHVRKAGSEDIMDEVSGTTGLTGAADQIMILSRERGNSSAEAALFVSGRDMEELQLALAFEKESCNWITVGDLDEARRSKERQEILDLIEKEGALTPKEIAEKLSKKGSTVRYLLMKMTENGSVIKNTDKKYIIRPKGTMQFP